MGEVLTFQNYASNTVAASPEQRDADRIALSLQHEIDMHRDADKHRSYMGKGFSFLYRGDEDSLDRLTKLQNELQVEMQQQHYGAVNKMHDEVYKAINDDRKSLGRQDDVSMYGGTLLKVGALFVGGKFGLGATAAFYAADQARPEDAAWKQLVDAGMGAGKGVAYRTLINGVMGSGMPIPAKAFAMSFGGRTLDTALTLDNYYDAKSGGYNFMTGLKATGAEATNLQHLAVDGTVMTLGFGLGYGLNRLLGPTFAASPIFSRVAMSSMAGFSAGAVNELVREHNTGENFSFTSVLGRGAIMGGIYGIAAVPGAIQADHQVRAEKAKLAEAEREAALRNNPQARGEAEHPDLQFNGYRKPGTIRAERLTETTTWKTGNGDTMTGEAGDWKVTGADGSTWTVKPEIFEKTYSPVPGSAGEFAKTAITRAARLSSPLTVQTREGTGSGVAGDYLVVGPDGDQYIVGGAKFESMYRQVSE